MSFEQNIWTVLLTYSFVHGYVLSAYTVIKLRRVFLAYLLFAVSTLIVIHLYYRFAWFKTVPHLIFMDGPVWYLIGPLFYFFVRQLFNLKVKWWEYLIHFTPAILFLIYLIPFIKLSGPEKARTFIEIFSTETYDGDINHYVFSTHIFIYLLIAYRLFNKESKKMYDQSASSVLIFDTLASRLLRYYLFFFLIGFGFYVFADLYYSIAINYYVIYYFGLSALIHLTFYFSLNRKKASNDALKEPVDFNKQERKYSSSSLSNSEMDQIINKIINYISDFEIYKNPELRLRVVSDETGIPSHHISQTINQKLGKSFFDLVNEQRIEGVKKNIDDPKYKNYTLLGIASDHGFKSSSSFYRIFKKYTGSTPKEYFSES